jgi:erythromycin esterase-like protein
MVLALPRRERRRRCLRPRDRSVGTSPTTTGWCAALHGHVALVGEASHGTHEFYCERAEITKRLIAEEGFTAVAVEGDWPDAYRVNLYVRGASGDETPEEALADFRRFPAWMRGNLDTSLP